MFQPSIEIDANVLIQTAMSLKAIAHPVRLAMIELLKDGQIRNVTEIYEQLGLEQAVASQHLAVLRDKDIVVGTREGKHTYYALQNECVVSVLELMMNVNQETEAKA